MLGEKLCAHKKVIHKHKNLYVFKINQSRFNKAMECNGNYICFYSKFLLYWENRVSQLLTEGQRGRHEAGRGS